MLEKSDRDDETLNRRRNGELSNLSENFLAGAFEDSSRKLYTSDGAKAPKEIETLRTVVRVESDQVSVGES